MAARASSSGSMIRPTLPPGIMFLDPASQGRVTSSWPVNRSRAIGAPGAAWHKLIAACGRGEAQERDRDLGEGCWRFGQLSCLASTDVRTSRPRDHEAPRPSACPSPAIADRIPVILRAWMQPFRACLTAPVWQHVLVLVLGAVLAPGKRTVTAVLRIMGLDAISNFTRYHQVLNRARWSSRAAARCLLGLIVTTLLGDGPVVIGFDDTVERRWGPRIAARGIYRDPVRSSKEHFVKTSGLRWLCFLVLAPIPWAGRVWALPFLSILAPSERYHAERGRRHKTLTDWARQGILCVCRWLPRRRLVFVGDSSFAVLDLLAAVREHATVISRLRLDANLFASVPQRRPRKRGRRPVKGRHLPKLKQRLADAATAWRTVTLTGWYGNQTRTVTIASDVALWYRAGSPPVPLP